MVVISVSLGGKELKEFDAVLNKMGYSSRSDAVREALHHFVAQNKWASQVSGPSHLLISMIYEDEKTHKVTDILHQYSNIIHSSSHTHIDHKCVDQLLLKGEFQALKSFMEELASVKDVRVCQCSL